MASQDDKITPERERAIQMALEASYHLSCSRFYLCHACRLLGPEGSSANRDAIREHDRLAAELARTMHRKADQLLHGSAR
jgi:hypothetical protein